jgi:carbon monoxide dehydrogenase subunit G
MENSFEVDAPPERAWELLMDVPRVIPCMPGAELTETVDDSNWKAKVGVKLGPISLTFNADVERTEVDEAARRATLRAMAREARGRGNAQAIITSSLAPADGGTRVDIATELALTGAVAQYGRGIVQDVAAQLVSRFADCLQKQLAASPDEAVPAAPAAAKPVSGLSLGLRAVGSSFGRFVRRLVRRT